uniref:Aliphatic sulfonates import ATP-binding protein SsuB n=2 Tax=Hirondellea gigas TaxID=1518452 RepID=A0A6A7G9H5_9CRUS
MANLKNKKITKKIIVKKKPAVLIDIKGIEKKYGKVEVLKGISFSMAPGEKVAIVGANGAGKSTLSEILAKVKEPSKGQISYYFEEDGTESLGKSDISSNIGIQFQNSSYPDFYKVKDLVDFVIGAAGIKITEESLDHLYETFDLAKLKKDVAKGLSGGQQQRLNILLAIVNNPKLLILDEVGTGLDVESRTKIKAYIKSYAEENEAAILLVSHNSDEVVELVDRVIVIHNGLVFNDQPLKEILDK